MRRLGAVLLALLLLAGLSGCGQPSGASDGAAGQGTELEVYCFQAGKADAFLLTTPNSAVLIDCGEKGFGQTILDRLAEQGIDAIDVLILTHFDQDHVGGAAKVLNNIPVGTVLQNDSPKDSTEVEKYRKALDGAGLEPVTLRETYEFQLDGVAYSVDPPHSASYQEDQSNNSSLIVSVVNGRDSLLFTGDAQTERLEEFLDANARTYDFLKIPHHGGEETLMEALIQSVQPALAVITSSEEDPEAESTLRALEAQGVEVFLTRLGPVMIKSSGAGVTAAYAA